MGDFNNDALYTRLAQLQTSEESRGSTAAVVFCSVVIWGKVREMMKAKESLFSPTE